MKKTMELKLNELREQINELNSQHAAETAKLREQINEELDPLFEQDEELQTALKKLENGENDGYMLEFEDLVSWLRFFELTNYKGLEQELEAYLSENYGYIRADFENDCLIMSHGPEFYFINENGEVWLNGELVIELSQYKDENGDWNEELRNKLINEHMERNGWFPEVVSGNERTDEVFLVQTIKQT
jgi:hypothetical protein